MSVLARPRRWNLIWAIAFAALLLGEAGGSAQSAQQFESVDLDAAAAAAWPVSDGLVVGEVVTRGAAASDQYAEIYNGAAAPRPLANLELAYVTASGATVTRKASWMSGSLQPGQRLLVANSAGTYAASADATFSGGFSTSGGSLVLRVIGGEVIDALSWGTATSAFIESTQAPGPPTGSSIERRPGAGQGNWTDTNDNLADTWTNPAPVAESFTSAPAPRPAQGIAAVREQPLGTTVTLHGVLTTPWLLEGGRGAFIQDDGAGIALLLDEGAAPGLPVGSNVGATGLLDRYFGLLVVRLSSDNDTWWAGEGLAPLPVETSVGALGEPLESMLVRVEGIVFGSPEPLVDGGFTVGVDDGTGTITVIAAAGAGVNPAALAAGQQVALTGVIGRRDLDPQGPPTYRLHLRSAEDVVSIEPEPSPSPTAAPTPLATPTPLPTATSSAPPTPTPTPTAFLAIAVAREHTIGSSVTVQGIVTVQPGRILGDRTLAIQDDTGGICVRLADTNFAGLAPGGLVAVSGELAAPYGNLELRPAPNGIAQIGSAAVPQPLDIALVDLGEATEGLRVRVEGTVRRIDASTTSLTLIVADATGEGRVFIHAPLGLAKTDFHVGQRLRVTGVAGDRMGLYRVWPADAADIVNLPAYPGPGSTPTPPPSPTPSSGAAGVVTIARALAQPGQTLTVEGTVTVPAGLLDADGRRIVIQDSTAAVLVRLPAGATASALGRRVRLSGSIGTWYRAPQLAAYGPPQLLGNGSVTPIDIRATPLGRSLEWRLVRVSGRFGRVTRSGDTWRAELELAAGSLPVAGLARSDIAAPVAGRAATIVGIVRRAYPTATDQRFAVVPRSMADIAIGTGPIADGGSPPDGSAGPGGPDGATGPGAPGGPGGPTAGLGAGPGAGAPAVALAELAGHAGRTVVVGGRIVSLDGLRLVLADDSGRGRIRLAGDARPVAALLGVGDVINAAGMVELAGDDADLVVTEPGDVRRAATLTVRPQVTPAAPSEPPAVAGSTVEAAAAAGLEPIGWLSLLGLGALSGMVAVRAARRRLDPRMLVSRFLANRRGRVRI